jgi:cysteinyl-tRNA synthetase
MIYLTNTLSHRKEIFTPLDPTNIRMYVCGPTVYDRPHIGNARSAVVYDLLYRLLKTHYAKVTYVRNITDVDDKIIIRANETNQSINDLTRSMTTCYHQDLAALNCLQPTHEPRATDHITQMINMISKLIELEHAYEAEGHVLFSVASYKDYGLLSGRNIDEMIAGARVEIAPFKKHPADFVLWKPTKDSEKNASFDSPWGLGRPGWHIECSAMSQEYLGETFDIHGGGADLTFPHHENEIAQSMCANKTALFAKVWVHNGFLTVEGEKMSKSLGNFHTVHEVLAQGLEGVILRYFYLTAHYRKPLDYNQKALDDSFKALERFRELLKDLEKQDITLPDEFMNAIADDLNTPAALAYIHELANKVAKGDLAKKHQLAACLDFLGLNYEKHSIAIPAHVTRIAEARKDARSARDWAKADILRQQLLEAGYEVKDNETGYELKAITILFNKQ